MRVINLASGSKGNSTLIEHSGTSLLIDAGISAKLVNEKLLQVGSSIEKVSAILVSHNHIDHIKAVVRIANKYNIPVYAPRECYQDEKLQKLEKRLIHEISLEDFLVGEIKVSTFEVPHDALKTIGFVFYADGNKVSLVTDVGELNEIALRQVENSNLIMIESNYDEKMLENGPYPYPLKRRIASNMGHLSNRACARHILELSKRGTKHFMLMHLSEINNTPEIAYNTVMNVLYDEYGENNEVMILMANQNEVSPNFNFKPRTEGSD